MPRLIVPTRNRPAEIHALLAFLSIFYPGTRLSIADGSDIADQDKVAEICEIFSQKISLNHLRYPAQLPLFERLLDIMQSESDDYLALCADDDYPLMDVYARGQEILDQNRRCANVVPAAVLLRLGEEDSLVASLAIARNLPSSVPAARVRDFGTWQFATSYSIARRSALIERYRMLSRITSAGFIDFQVGVEDCLSGTIVALEQIGTIRTHRPSASYLRPLDKLMMLRQSSLILEIIEQMKNRLISRGSAKPDQAERIIHQATTRHMAHLLGAGAATRIGFSESSQFRNETVQIQYKTFYEMFSEQSEIHRTMIEMLRFIVKNLRSIHAASQAREARNYENI